MVSLDRVDELEGTGSDWMETCVLDAGLLHRGRTHDPAPIKWDDRCDEVTELSVRRNPYCVLTNGLDLCNTQKECGRYGGSSVWIVVRVILVEVAHVVEHDCIGIERG